MRGVDCRESLNSGCRPAPACAGRGSSLTLAWHSLPPPRRPSAPGGDQLCAWHSSRAPFPSRPPNKTSRGGTCTHLILPRAVYPPCANQAPPAGRRVCQQGRAAKRKSHPSPPPRPRRACCESTVRSTAGGSNPGGTAAASGWHASHRRGGQPAPPGHRATGGGRPVFARVRCPRLGLRRRRYGLQATDIQ